MFIKVKSGTKPPKYATKDSAGADLYAAEDLILVVGDTKVVKTNTYIDLAYGRRPDIRAARWFLRTFFGIIPELQVRPRSGLAVKGVSVRNSPGTIDADYPDEIGVILYAAGPTGFQVKVGDRIAQLVGGFTFRVKGCDESADTRKGGFGSTGSKG